MNHEQTELDLLEIAIKAECGTKIKFAEKIGKTRQALNDIIRKARKAEGKLKPKFIQELKMMYGIDIYKWKRNPTLDFHSPTELQSLTAAEEVVPYTDKQMIIHLMKQNDRLSAANSELREQLRQCMADKKKNPRRSA